MKHASPSGLLRIVLIWLALAAALPAQPTTDLFAGPGRGAAPLTADQAFRVATRRAADCALEVKIDVAAGYHLYRARLTAATTGGAALMVDSPPGTIEEDPNFGRVEIWRGTVAARVASDGGAAVLRWQGCADPGICYPPQRLTIPAMAAAAGSGPAVSATATVPPTFAPQDGLMAGLLLRGGATLVLLAFAGFGLLLAFTPCSLPMVPVLAGMLAAGGGRMTPARGAALTGAYVLAVASAFGLLGLAAAWSGQNLQVALQSPPVIWTRDCQLVCGAVPF
ncbi:protein-disulfide reductase DsbD domain-containing protein [Solirhodobacter olei]|uniref:cytochrome c biogenesis protein CcdA n=1 Tax=Solirhodobacter olei TaxID=2493082 RepID=UPI000FD76256|nr:protein-disulfide reductase DsbD domain-containing protein [Solirhodobacter olei]